MRRALTALVALAAAAPAIALPAAAAQSISIAMDEVRTITFPQPVATIYVGNPAIADINMIDSRHAFLLGKGYGNTNLVALAHDGGQIADTQITVMARNSATVVLNRGANRVTYNCTADHCEATPQPGDGKDAFESESAQISAHQDAAQKAASEK